MVRLTASRRKTTRPTSYSSVANKQAELIPSEADKGAAADRDKAVRVAAAARAVVAREELAAGTVGAAKSCGRLNRQCPIPIHSRDWRPPAAVRNQRDQASHQTNLPDFEVY